jgi:hypothetical protein
MSEAKPHGLLARLKARFEAAQARWEPVVREWEWTWTRAVLFSLALLFFLLISMVIIPSFWMYFAEQKLGWSGPSGGGSWALEFRDAIAMGLATGPLITLWIVASVMQNWRRKLRGQTVTRPTGGYR